MKIVPILAITNALALGAALLLYLDLDDLKSQVGTSRGASRVTGQNAGEQTSGYTQAQLDRAIERALAKRAPEGAARVAPESTGDAPAEEPEAIDRGLASGGSFDVATEKARPEMDYFRQRVRLASELNENEDQITREVERIDGLIDSARIGSMTPVQKKKVAEVLVESRGKTRLIWTGLRDREDLQSLPQEERRDAYREAYRGAAETLRVETQKSLESVIPAPDATALMEANRGGGFDMGGRARGGPTRTGGAGR